MSVIFVKEKDSSVKIFAVFMDYKSVNRIVQHNGNPKEKFGFYYYRFDADNDFLHWRDVAPNAIEIGYGLLLPLLEETDGNQSRLHALISSNWKTLSPSVNLSQLVDVKSATFN